MTIQYSYALYYKRQNYSYGRYGALILNLGEVSDLVTEAEYEAIQI